MTTEQKPTVDEMEELDFGMSNFDHSIDDEFETALRSRPCQAYGPHAGWNFYGRVWFDPARGFVEQVKVYNVVRGEYVADSLQELMDLVNSKFGVD